MTRREAPAMAGQASCDVARTMIALVESAGGRLSRHAAEAARDALRQAEDGMMRRSDFARLYAACTQEIDRIAAQQESREQLSKTGFEFMCRLVIDCPTLRHAIARIDQYAELIGPRMARMTVREEGPNAVVVMATQRRRRNACAYFSDLTGLSSFHRLFGWLVGAELPLVAAQLCYPPLLEPELTAYLLPHRIEHMAEENGLCLPAHCLDRALIRDAQELDALLPHFPFDLLHPRASEEPLSVIIARQLRLALAGGAPMPSLSVLARRHGVSTATLKRALMSEGTGLGALKQAARRDQAMQLLANPTMTVTAIAHRCQFSDASAFRRAFTQWEGVSPAKWRRTGHPASR